MQKQILKINKEYLKSIYTGHYHTPDVYFHRNPLVRYIFWERLEQIVRGIKKNVINNGACLDFGGGSGVFLPTLSQLFKEVILIDLEPSQAILIKEKYHLNNCKIIKADIFDFDYSGFDCIIAADVLEHFQDTLKIAGKLKALMKGETRLFTSLPTENYFYRLMRRIFHEERPFDHYFGAKEIESTLKSLGFDRIFHIKIPFPSLFHISGWKVP